MPSPSGGTYVSRTVPKLGRAGRQVAGEGGQVTRVRCQVSGVRWETLSLAYVRWQVAGDIWQVKVVR